jgi:hypothetical protein
VNNWCSTGRIAQRGTAYDRTRRFVGNSKYQMSTTLIGDGDAVGAELFAVQAGFRFLELEVLMFRPRPSP